MQEPMFALIKAAKEVVEWYEADARDTVWRKEAVSQLREALRPFTAKPPEDDMMAQAMSLYLLVHCGTDDQMVKMLLDNFSAHVLGLAADEAMGRAL